MAYIFLIGAFTANAVANLFLKVGADRGINLDWSLGISKLVSLHSFLIAGTVLFVVNLLLYILALKSLPLSIAYPVMVGMSFLIASFSAVLFLHESISWFQILGYVLVVTGITFAVYAR